MMMKDKPMRHDPVIAGDATDPNETLAKYGLRASIEGDFLIIRGKDGRECTYSGRIFARVGFPGLPVLVEARLLRLGVGEIRIDGESLTFDGKLERQPAAIE
jgi:hypothetical protein